MPFILDPLIRAGTLGLIYGPPGVGKSLLALAIARAAAAGESLLGWRAPHRQSVFYLDGDSDAAEMARRLALFGPPPPSLTFSLLGAATTQRLDLGTTDGLKRLVRSWGHSQLVVIDLSSLAGFAGWDALRLNRFGRFLVMQRRKGRAIVIVDHANREGELRGNASREDVLDLVIALQRPTDWQPQLGCRFEMRFEKTRNLHGDAVAPRRVELRNDGPTRAVWEGTCGLSRQQRAALLLRQGLSAEAMGRALGVSPRTGYRLQAKAQKAGEVPFKRSQEKTP